jgi:hypothetical protein
MRGFMAQELTAICKDDPRRDQVRARSNLCGLDYLEVGDDQLTLTVTFLGRAPAHITPANLRVEGGRRVPGRTIKVLRCRVTRSTDPDVDDTMQVWLDRYGDFSTYTLHLVDVTGVDRVDPRYDQIDFTFKVDCPSDLDCQTDDACPPAAPEQIEINYLAKDYASFRQLILDRLAVVMPEWKEQHAADIGNMLVEVLAYTGDYLSYYQDAVATEAYLMTARQRISVRRHARLVDYLMHEGCNARAWVCVQVDPDSKVTTLDAQDVSFITHLSDPALSQQWVISSDALRGLAPSAYEVFEPVWTSSVTTLTLYAAHNRIEFYTWGERECCLPRGTTRATLRDEWDDTPAPASAPAPAPAQTSTDTTSGPASTNYPSRTPQQPPQPPGKAATYAQSAPAPQVRRRRLHPHVGDVLIFEEVVGPRTGNLADADPSHRQAVRLTRVEPGVDELDNTPVVEIEWAAEDALTFPLCLSALGDAPKCDYECNISVAWGNVILVDHGRHVWDEPLGGVPTQTTVATCDCEGHPSDVRVLPGHYNPQLTQRPLTYRERPQMQAPASCTAQQDPRRAYPQIVLTGAQETSLGTTRELWLPQQDLLSSGPDDRHFVAEIDDDGYAHLRFGDGEFGRAPAASTTFSATYRIGIGLAGNVGADTLTHLVYQHDKPNGIIGVRNPLPAQGGIDAEPVAEVKLFAPTAFRKELQRAITPEDYAQITERNPRVQNAAAQLCWTGSWYEMQVAVDALGSKTPAPAWLEKLEHSLHRYRRIGYDLEVTPARYVSLDIAMDICVDEHYLRGHVEKALRDVFSNRALPDGRPGFFHPDRLTFGEGIYLSQLVAVAMSVKGVRSAQVTRLQRQYEPANHELERGLLPLGPFEIARVDNDRNYPEHGLFMLNMQGGR